VQNTAATMRAQVYAFLTRQGRYGATDEEISDALAMPGNTERPRRVELENAGFVVDSGGHRQTRSGRNAVVWITIRNATHMFSWSYSQLKNAETCLKRYFHYNVEKDVTEPESQELVEGNQLHAHFAARLSPKHTPLPLGYGQHEPMLAKLVNAPGTLYAEQKLALTNEFKPIAFFGKNVWFRTVIDAAKVREDHSQASIFDWKTGRVREDPTQLQLMAATMFHQDPKLQRVKAGLVFVNQDHVERAEFVREDVTEIWGEILPRVKALQVAREKQEFPPKPSGLCKKYCAVRSCPYNGR
jgi:hypothetical protein